MSGDRLPNPTPPFAGTVGRLINESEAVPLQGLRSPAGAPNVVLILLDDVGFGTCSTFGGPVPTPTVDRVARAGLRYNQFHTTALCSPTRAALLTGRNHHAVHMGGITEIANSFPGTTVQSRGRRPPLLRSCGGTATARAPSANGTSRPRGSRARRGL